MQLLITLIFFAATLAFGWDAYNRRSIVSLGLFLFALATTLARIL